MDARGECARLSRVSARMLVSLLVLVGVLGTPREASARARTPIRVLREGEDELERWLARAAGRDWTERARAQRWLAAHLSSADVERVARAVAAGDAELAARLVQALGREPRLFELCARLALRPEPAAARLGREALREAILEWDARAEEPFASVAEWFPPLRQRWSAGFSAEAATWARGPALLLDLLARVSNGPALVADPALAPRAPSRAHEGSAPELLLAAAAEEELAALATPALAESGRGAQWIVLLPRGPQSAPTPLELVTRWITTLADESRAIDERAACARALASSEWPEVLGWLERRWLAGDAAALDGLLLAAGRGAAVAALADPVRQRALIGELGALAEQADDSRAGQDPAQALRAARRASAIARALGAAGPCARDGTRLDALALEGFERAGARERWLRLALLEALGSAPPSARETIDGLIAARETPPALRVQALRTRAALALDTPAPALGGAAAELLEWADTPARLAELVALVRRTQTPWPAGWTELGARAASLPPAVRGALFELALRADVREAALDQARALLADRAPAALAALREALAAVHLDAPERALSALEICDEAADDAGRERLCAAALLAGLAPRAQEMRALERWLAEGPANGAQALALATQAAGPHASEVRARLVELLGAKLGVDERVEPLFAAARVLAASAWGAGLEALVAAAREKSRTSRDLELRARLRPDRWPPPPLAPLRALEQEQRELERW